MYTKLRALLFTAALLGVPSTLKAQQFFDCEADPGDYIIKYKEARPGEVASFNDARSRVHSKLHVSQARGFFKTTRTEHLKITSSKEEVKRMIRASELKDLEYIQPNCKFEPSEFSVSGTLRDPAARAPQYPLPVGAKTDSSNPDLPLLDLISKPRGLHSSNLYGSIEEPEIFGSLNRFHAMSDRIGEGGLLNLWATSYYEGNADQREPILMKFQNRGNGSFVLANSFRFENSTSLGGSSQLAFDDLNSDGEVDVVMGLGDRFRTGTIKVLLSTDSKSPREVSLKASNAVNLVATADINRDGLSDIIAHTSDWAFLEPLHGANDKIEYFLNRGGGEFAPRKVIDDIPGWGIPRGLRLGDLNKDGAPDLVILQGSNVLYGLNQGDGTFGEFSAFSFYHIFGDDTVLVVDYRQEGDLELVDMNNDSYLDAVFMARYAESTPFTTTGHTSVAVIFFNEAETIRSVEAVVVGESRDDNQDSIAFKDIDGNGFVDFTVARKDNDTIQVQLNQGPDKDDPFVVHFEQDMYYDFLIGSSPKGAIILDPFAIANTVVQLTRNGQSFYTITDSEGHFTFSGIPAGTYTINVLSNTYAFPTLEGTTVEVKGNISEINHWGKRLPPVPPNAPRVPAPNAPNDYAFNWLWGLYNYGQLGGTPDVDVDAPEAWSKTRGAGVVVGILDTGLDVYHPEIKDSVLVNKGEIPGNRIDDDKNGVVDDAYGFNPFGGTGDPVDTDFHGTHVAGTIGATGDNRDGIVGVAPEAKILLAKIFEGPSASLAAILKSVDYFIAAKEKGANLRVVNASFGGRRNCSPAELDYLRALLANDILFVAAAGNHKSDNDVNPNSPSNCDVANVLSVAAVDNTGALASFSNFGKQTVDVAAPGQDILSLMPEQGYKLDDGTSMAAPHVTGVAALLFAAEPQLTAVEAKARLMATTKLLPSLDGKIVSPGIVSAAAAIANSGHGGGGSDNSGGGGLGAPPPSPQSKVTYVASSVKAKAKTPFRLTFSEPLKSGSESCFKATLSPKKKGDSIKRSSSGNLLAFTLVRGKGKKSKIAPWPASGKLSVKISAQCAEGVSGAPLDTDQDGRAGGPQTTLTIAFGKAKR